MDICTSSLFRAFSNLCVSVNTLSLSGVDTVISRSGSPHDASHLPSICMYACRTMAVGRVDELRTRGLTKNRPCSIFPNINILIMILIMIMIMIIMIVIVIVIVILIVIVATRNLGPLKEENFASKYKQYQALSY